MVLVLIGSIFGLTPFAVASVALPSPTSTTFFVLGVIPLALVPITFTYAIVRFQLLDIRVILRRSLLYTVTTALVTSLYAGGIAMFNAFFRDTALAAGGYFPIILALAIVVLFDPVRRRVQDLIDRSFFAERSRLQSALEELTEAMTARSDLAGGGARPGAAPAGDSRSPLLRPLHAAPGAAGAHRRARAPAGEAAGAAGASGVPGAPSRTAPARPAGLAAAALSPRGGAGGGAGAGGRRVGGGPGVAPPTDRSGAVLAAPGSGAAGARGARAAGAPARPGVHRTGDRAAARGAHPAGGAGAGDGDRRVDPGAPAARTDWRWRRAGRWPRSAVRRASSAATFYTQLPAMGHDSGGSAWSTATSPASRCRAR